MGNTLFTIIGNDDIENIISSCGTTAFSVFAFLKMMQGKNGKCWPSLNYLCSKMKLSKNTILVSIKKLEEKKFISVDHGKNIANNYAILGGSKIEPGVQKLNSAGSKNEPGGSKIEPLVQKMNHFTEKDESNVLENLNLDNSKNELQAVQNNNLSGSKIEPGVQKLNQNNIYNNIQKQDSFNNIHDFSLLSQPYQILSKFCDWQPEIASALQKKENFVFGYLQIIDRIIKFEGISIEIIFAAKNNIDSNPFYRDKPHLKTVEWFFKLDKNGQGAAAHIRKLANNHKTPIKSRYQKI